MLEGHHVSDKDSDSFRTSYPEIHEKFWKQLQMLLKKILAMTISASANKSAPVSQPNTVSNRSGDAENLRELYKISEVLRYESIACHARIVDIIIRKLSL